MFNIQNILQDAQHKFPYATLYIYLTGYLLLRNVGLLFEPRLFPNAVQNKLLQHLVWFSIHRYGTRFIRMLELPMTPFHSCKHPSVIFKHLDYFPDFISVHIYYYTKAKVVIFLLLNKFLLINVSRLFQDSLLTESFFVFLHIKSNLRVNITV